MSATMHEPTTATAAPVVTCPDCVDRPFAPVTDRGEAEFLAGVHNQLEHGGGQVAAVTTPTAEQDAPGVSGLGWVVSPEVYEDACAQAVPFAGDATAADRAWSARVDAAVAGMDVIDSSGLDGWMGEHAASVVPHLVEAGLVAAWETHVRSVYDQDTTTVAEQVLDRTADDDVDDWS